MDDLVGVSRTLDVDMAEGAYRDGVFPMAEPRLGIYTWHRPDPRALMPLDRFHVSRSLEKTLRRGIFDVSYDRDFRGVMAGCADRDPTWIDERIKSVYEELHAQGKAHSVEVWKAGELVGGTYGVHLGGAFFAESKFHRVTDASKVALASLARRLRERDFDILEVQYLTEHLQQFGAYELSLEAYLKILKQALKKQCSFN